MDSQVEETPTSSVEERSAQDYADAMNAVLDIAEIAVGFIPGVGAAAKAAQVAPKAIRFARGAAAAIPAVAPVVGPAAKKVADHAPEAVGQRIDTAATAVGGLFKGVAGAVGGAVDAAGSAVKGALDEKAQEEARRAARKAILDGAGVRMSVATFRDNWDMNANVAPVSAGSYLNYCGCYVLAVYGSTVKKDDYGTFRDIYVGASTDMGKSIHDDISGKGNIDIYADVKYKQHVYMMLYPCAEDKLEALKDSLVTALDADKSYNR